MQKHFRLAVSAAALATGMLLTQVASAATSATGCTNPPNSSPAGHTFVVDTNLAETCFTTGTGNIGGNENNDILVSQYDLTFLGGVGPGSPAPNPIYFDSVSVIGLGATSGSFTIDVTQTFLNTFGSLFLGFKVGENLPTDWAAFQVVVTSDLITGIFSITPENGGQLSHLNFYGGGAPNPVPLPGALVLMGTVLAGGAGFGAMRKRRAKKAAGLQAA